MEQVIILSTRYVISAYIGKVIVGACLVVGFYALAGAMVFRVHNPKKKLFYRKVITAMLIISAVAIYVLF